MAALKAQWPDRPVLFTVTSRYGKQMAERRLEGIADAVCFSPRESMQEVLEHRHEARTTPPSQGNSPGTNRKVSPKRQPGEEYEVASYRRAIARACDRLGIPRWSPHQLRHLAATELRKKYGRGTVVPASLLGRDRAKGRDGFDGEGK